MWTKVRIRIISHPRLIVGMVYSAARDESYNYYVEDLQTGINETVWESEAEEMPECDCGPGHICDIHGDAKEAPHEATE